MVTLRVTNRHRFRHLVFHFAMGCSHDSEVERTFQLFKRKGTEPVTKYISQCTMHTDLKDRWRCRSCSTELAYNAVRMCRHLQTKCKMQRSLYTNQSKRWYYLGLHSS